MCGLAGIIFGKKRRTKKEIQHLLDIFTRLLVLSEARGHHATGVAWVKTDGTYDLFKAPMPASELVQESRYVDLLAGVENKTIMLMGHTRWRTQGSEFNNGNNHPVLTGEVLGTVNGTIFNADDLFRCLRYSREAEVDSEILCRIVNGATQAGTLNLSYLRKRLVLCRGHMSGVFVSKALPDSVLVLKGDKPLKIRCHMSRQVILYASQEAYLNEALGKERGWMEIMVPAMRLVVFNHELVYRPMLRPFSFIAQAEQSQEATP